SSTRACTAAATLRTAREEARRMAIRTENRAKRRNVLRTLALTVPVILIVAAVALLLSGQSTWALVALAGGVAIAGFASLRAVERAVRTRRVEAGWRSVAVALRRLGAALTFDEVCTVVCREAARVAGLAAVELWVQRGNGGWSRAAAEGQAAA